MKQKFSNILLILLFALLLASCATPTATPTATVTPSPVTVESPQTAPASRDSSNNATFPDDFFNIFSVPFWDWSLAQWLNLGVSLLLFIIIARFGGPLILKIFREVTKRTNTKVDDAIYADVAQPIRWLGYVIGFQLAYSRLPFITHNWLALLENMTFVFYSIVITFMIWKFINYFISLVHAQGIKNGADEKALNRVLPLLQTFIKASLIIISFIIVLNHFGIEVTAIIAALGISGFAISLAAKDLLTNLIAGVTIAVDRPFRIGDRIYSKDVNAWVDVEEIGVRSTRVRTRDNRAIVIPNSSLSDASVINYNYPSRQFRLQVDIGVAYDSDIGKVRQVLGDAVRQVDGVMPENPIQVLFIEFGESAMIFRVRWWIEDYAQMRAVNDRVYEALQTAMTNNNIVSPGPILDVNYHFGETDADHLAKAFKKHE
ncbi:MAG: mechanosensitive ion channel family protein [Anaerolineae bacterium]|nr:mechanosensitive ion channel family protein [Anaerolineae bacterium]